MLIPIYEKLANVYKLDEDVIIANLDAYDHKHLAQKYGVTGYPTLKFFPKNNKTGEAYNGFRHLEDLVSFINEKSGTSRDANGQLTSQAGVVASLDALVKEFVSINAEEQKGVLSKMEEEVNKLKGSFARHGEVYLKAAKSYMEKGSNYIKKETERLKRILEKQSISFAKTDEFVIKKNIISTFASRIPTDSADS